MKKQLLSVILACIPFWLAAQSTGLYRIGNSGCSVNLPCMPSETPLARYSPDSSEVYSTYCDDGTLSYDVTCVKLARATQAALKTKEDYRLLLKNYLDFLKSDLHIVTESAYVFKDANDDTNKVILTFTMLTEESDTGQEFRVQASCNGKYLSVLMAVADLNHFPESISDSAQRFLGSIVFPK